MAARRESTSPIRRYDVTQANTGSVAKIRAVRVGLVQRCAQVWTVKAKAVASKLVTASAIQTLPEDMRSAPAQPTRT